MTASRSTLLFLIATALAGLAVGLLSLAETVRRTSPVAVYTLTPLLSKGVWRVQLELTGVPPGRVALLPPEASPVFASAADTARDAVALMPFWWVQADERGTAELLYEVRPEDGGSRHALFFGSRLFAVPVLEAPRDEALFLTRGGARPGRVSRIELHFVMPAGWDAYTPWGETESRLTVPGGGLAALREGILAIGDFVPRRFREGRTDILLATRGTDPAGEDQIEDLVRDCLRAHTASLGPLPYRRALIAVLHPFRGEQANGRATANAVALQLSSEPNALAWRSTWRVVAHELFHFWNGGALAYPLPDDRWFLEGASDYYGLRALAASGRLSLGDFADELALAYDQLEGNRWADSSNVVVSRAAGEDAAATTAAYAKGALCAWAVDLRLAPRGGLESALRASARQGVTQPVETHLRSWSGDLVGGLLDSLSGPRFRTTLANELRANGLRFERVPAGRLTLGLRSFLPGTTEILDLDPRGPAYRSGVRAGDRVVAVNGHSVRDLAALAERLADARGSLHLSLAREGGVERVRVVPAPAYRRRVVPFVEPRLMAKTEPAPGRLAE